MYADYFADKWKWGQVGVLQFGPGAQFSAFFLSVSDIVIGICFVFLWGVLIYALIVLFFFLSFYFWAFTLFAYESLHV